jgi:hypothetical protein
VRKVNKKNFFSVILRIFFVSILLLVFTIGVRRSYAKSAQGNFKLSNVLQNLPISFEKNVGQAGDGADVVARGRGYNLLLTNKAAVLELRSFFRKNSLFGNKLNPEETALQSTTKILKVEMVGSNQNPTLLVNGELPGKVNYLIGNNSANWFKNIPTFSKVTYGNLYPGIDLTYYGNQGQIEYDFNVSPGSDFKNIIFRLSGSKKMDVNLFGDIIIDLDGQNVKIQKPQIYQVINGVRKNIPGNYIFLGNNEFSFQIDQYDKNHPLTIDPFLIYSTFFGGSAGDNISSMVLDNSGSLSFAGSTNSLNFPTLNAVQSSYAGGSSDTYVTKLSNDGSYVIYSTYIGGSSPSNNSEAALAIAVDDADNAYVTGFTNSNNFPVVNSLSGYHGGVPGSTDGFVFKLSSDGDSLLYSTYLGGSDGDYPTGIAADGPGNAYIAGWTFSSDYPTVNAFQPSSGGTISGQNIDSFVSKLDSQGNSLVYSTYLGGSSNDYNGGIAIDSSGNAYIAGYTSSNNFPISNAFQSQKSSNTMSSFDAYLTKLSPNGQNLTYSTYLGGNSPYGASNVAQSVTVDNNGDAFVVGSTDSPNFPTLNALQPTLIGWPNNNAFITEFNTSGDGLIFSTFLGGHNNTSASKVVLGNDGYIYVAGGTQSVDFPVVDPVQASISGGQDAFVSRITPNGGALSLSTYLGGSGDDYSGGVAVDGTGNIYIGGTTGSSNFPIINSIQPGIGGQQDAFLSKISPLSRQLSSLSPAKIWVGLKNSDDVGIKFDLLAEAYKDGVLVSSGQLNSVVGGSSGFSNAKLNSIPFNSFSPLDFPAGSQLSIEFYVRNACSGSSHNSGTARLWYNDSVANSQFDATIGSSANLYYLLSGFVLGYTLDRGQNRQWMLLRDQDVVASNPSVLGQLLHENTWN